MNVGFDWINTYCAHSSEDSFRRAYAGNYGTT